MSWTERQRRMLGAMGVRLWSPAPAALQAANSADADPAAATPAASPALPAAAPRHAATVAAAAVAGFAAGRPTEAIAAAARAAAAAPRGSAPVAGGSARAPGAAAPAGVPELSDAALDERAAAIATLAWAPLKEAVAGCTACELCGSRRQAVFGVGHAHAHWMIVGEAPGEQEDLAGEPFVGAAGQLLDQMLRAVGQSRRAPGMADACDDEAGDPAHRVFIANTLKCRPPRNRNPEPVELARCEPFLRRQVALVQPRLILALGRFAVKTLLKSDEAIGKLRGRVHRYEGIPVIVSYHPAYLLRNLPDKAKAWEDLCLATSTLAAAKTGA